MQPMTIPTKTPMLNGRPLFCGGCVESSINKQTNKKHIHNNIEKSISTHYVQDIYVMYELCKILACGNVCILGLPENIAVTVTENVPMEMKASAW